MEYASDVSPMVLQRVINSDPSVLSRWFRLKITQKRKLLPSGRHYECEYEFHLNNVKVETQDTLKILGVVLDSKLTFKGAHKGTAEKKLGQRLQLYGDYASSFRSM